MRNRFIAAVVLASLACSSVPASFASAKSSASLNSHRPSQPSPSAAQHHSCCPGFHSSFVDQLFVELSPVPEMPCGDRHPCCERQAPQNPPALTAALRVERPRSQSESARVADPNVSCGTDIAADTSEISFFPSYFVRSTVLRI